MTYNSDLYSSFVDASCQPHGLSVIVVLFQLERTVPDRVGLGAIGDLLKNLKEIVEPQSMVHMKSFDPKVLLPWYNETYFRYYGSVRTSVCPNNVQWTVMLEKIPITAEQVGRTAFCSELCLC